MTCRAWTQLSLALTNFISTDIELQHQYFTKRSAGHHPYIIHALWQWIMFYLVQQISLHLLPGDQQSEHVLQIRELRVAAYFAVLEHECFAVCLRAEAQHAVWNLSEHAVVHFRCHIVVCGVI
jgi:hypothetical protein